MKYAFVFASVALAAEYGYGTPSDSSSSKIGYTTIDPGHGYEPVTVTKQYQPIPTYIPAEGYDVSTGSWSDYAFVSTVISDYNGNKYTITKTDQPVTVYHTKATYTHTSTDAGYAAPTGYYPTGGYVPKNSTITKTWYELYEKVHEVPYKDLGPHVLPGYGGSGLYKGDDKKQAVKVKEYKGGKWSDYSYTFTYGAPEPETSTYEHPGTYTIPAKDVTLDHTTTVPAEATYTAPAGKPVTYGGAYTTVTETKPTTITAGYAAYETEGALTKTVIHYKTITCTGTGKYEIAKPTVTSYAHDTTVKYPTTKVYTPGVYHHSKETVTITKPNQPYTCTYEQTSTYPTPSTTPTGSYPTATKDTYEEPSYPTSGEATATKPYGPDPSSDYEEPAESYGKPHAGYVKRGGVLERRKAEPEVKKAAGKRVILV
ncbi:hypothetical protein BS50DRAFT_579598 [Corynespora cassiicola Philippines]|uniref:Uncharacterized protein n=1 Tax=Corynespora cassiicola Philippines TaxID=1448308 RepID=A0A2T2N3W7_CORCC|nr:hypothetical protein BS50DRAFT_579598 [Corynespora cassiicola Philippines]